jgi:hypothetical protein
LRGSLSGAPALLIGRLESIRSSNLIGWRDIFWRIYQNVSEHRILAIAAGVTFYALLAIFPGIAALVALYGLFADPSTIGKHLTDLSGVLPGGAADVIGDQLQRLSHQGRARLGFAFLLSILISIWSANAGVKALFDALNVRTVELFLNFGLTLVRQVVLANERGDTHEQHAERVQAMSKLVAAGIFAATDGNVTVQ